MATSPGSAPRPDRLFAFGVALLVVGASAAALAWLARGTDGFPWLAVNVSVAAVAGLALALLRLPSLASGGLDGQLRAQQAPTVEWQRRYTSAILVGPILLAAAGLFFIAWKSRLARILGWAEFEAINSTDISLRWGAVLLWGLIGGLFALLVVTRLFRAGVVTSPVVAAAIALAILAAASACGFAYFAVLGLPAPGIPEGEYIHLVAPAWAASLLLSVFFWWLELKEEKRSAGSSRDGDLS